MTVVIADLVARIRADTTDVKAGTAQAAQGLQTVEAQARQTAAALDIMAAQFAKLHGGTAVDALKMFQSVGVQPTAAALDQAAKSADALGGSSQRAATGFQQAAAAAREAASATATFAGIARSLENVGVSATGGQVSSILAAQQHAQQQQAVGRALQEAGVSASVAAQQAKALTTEASSTMVSTQAAARAAEDVGKGWTVADSNVVRFGTSLLGVGLGISLVAGAARLIHDAISAVVTSQLDWERSLVRTHALYGSLAPNVVTMSQAQSQAAGLLGSQQEFLTANLNASYLSSRYGLPQSEVYGLTSAAGRVSNAYGLDAQARADLQARSLAFAESGGSVLRNITGTEGDPLSIARRLGGQSAAQLQALTPQQLREAQTLIGTVDLNQAALRTSAAGEPGLLEAQTRTQRALAQAQGALQNALEGGPSPGIIQSPTTSERALTQQILQYGQASAAEPPQPTPIDPAFIKAVADAQAAFDAATTAVGTNQKAIDDSTAALAKLGVEAGTATFRLLGFTGNLEDRASIARLDVGAQAQAAVAARAVGPNPLVFQSPAEIAAQAMDRASQDALRAFVAPQAQTALQRDQAIREQLASQPNTAGPGVESSQAALADLDRRIAAETARLQAQQAGGLAQRAQTEAQAQLTAINLQQDERRLSVAGELAGYRTQALQLEGQLAPLMLQQANLQDRMSATARDNLASRREMIAAEQQQLAITQVTSAYDYEQQRLELRAEQSRAVVRQGGAATEDISALREEYRSRELERAASGVDIQALDASRQVQVVGQQRTGEQLGRDATLTDLEAEGRALQDQTVPLEQHLRAMQAQEASIQRQLALMDLQDVRSITLAQHQLNAATQLALKAAEAERAAADLAANVNLGATSADRFAEAMSRGYAAINDSAVALSSVHDLLDAMPSLIVPTSAGNAANGGARSDRSFDSFPGLTPQAPIIRYDPSRASDQLPGLTSPATPAATVTTAPYTTGSLPQNLPMATLPGRMTTNPTPDRQDIPPRPVLLPSGNVSQGTNGTSALSVSVPLTINGQSPQQIKDEVHQAVEDALNRFFAGASTAGPAAPATVAGNGR